MSSRSEIHTAAWTLANQGLVSLGVFLVGILLARTLPPAEYGVYALLFGALLALQMVNGSLVFYPLSVRVAVVAADVRSRLILTSIVLSAALSIVLCIAIGVGILLFGRNDLLIPAIAWFLTWQLQETMRRVLFAEFRHGTALLGDGVSYLGRVAVIVGLSFFREVTLPEAFYAMALMSAAAAAIQAYQIRLRADRVRLSLSEIRTVTSDFWLIGGWSLANSLASLLRVQALPWTLAGIYGPALTAGFQAALNVVNLANPVVIGLCNVIPQAAAKGRLLQGHRSAWKAARPYAFLGAPPLFLYYGAALVAPGLILIVFYGPESTYSDLTFAVQVLTLAWIIGYPADMICSFLHGVDAARLALGINAAGAVSAVVLSVPLVVAFGLTGGCLALAASNLVRAVAAYFTLTRMTTDDRPSYA